MSEKKICTCDNCGEDRQTEESYHSKPQGWLTAGLFDGDYYHACSIKCAIALTERSLETLKKKLEEKPDENE